MIDLKKDLYTLYSSRGVQTNEQYRAVIDQSLGPFVPYVTPVMTGMISTLFRSRELIAQNLVQNSIDEARGAVRIGIIAEKHAPPELSRKMKRHVGEEMKHSRQFRKLVELTGFRCEQVESDAVLAETGEVLDFDDDLREFICRVHSIEIRSWTMLRHYIEVLRAFSSDSLAEAIPVLEEIMSEEITHVTYTGAQLIEWLGEDPTLAPVLARCMVHTNRETWNDLASMSGYLAENFESLSVA